MAVHMKYINKLNSKWRRLREVTITTVFSNVPNLLLGSQLRRWFYPLIFKSLGKSVYIQEGTEFLGAHAIDIGSESYVFRGVYINARGEDNSIVIGQKTSLQRGVDIRALSRTTLRIGRHSFIGPFTCIAGPGNIEIGDNCSIGAHCGIFANNHKFDDPARGPNDQGLTRRGIVIEKECWIGHAASILDGVRIGEGSVIGAGAVVTRNIPPKSVAVGVPARVIKSRELLRVPQDLTSQRSERYRDSN